MTPHLRRTLALCLGQAAVFSVFCASALFRSYSNIAWQWIGLLAAGLVLYFLVQPWE